MNSEMLNIVLALINSGAIIFAFKFNATKQELQETKDELKEAREESKLAREELKKMIEAISDIETNICKR